MDKFIINGPSTLKGEVEISGAKNAVLPIMTACLAFPGVYTLKNVPMLRDTKTMIKLLEIIGADVDVFNDELVINSKKCNNPEAPYELVKTMRASFYVLGPLLSRFKYSKVSLPGGCAWGPRPVDYHIKAFEQMGAKVTLKGGYILAEGGLSGSIIEFEKSSVGATGNVLMACVNLNEKVIIKNAAMEPEIVDLCHFLIKIGVKIDGVGTSELTIVGLDNKTESVNIQHTIIPDRIEAGTFLIASAITKSDLKIVNVNPEHLTAVTDALLASGCEIEIDETSINIFPGKSIKPVNIITDIYPGYPTDLQAQWVVLMSLADGRSMVQDTIYNDRFSHIPELNRLGAQITLEENIAYIQGVKKLYGAEVMSTDIRASAAMILGGIAAYGQTSLSRIYHIDRGYENIEFKLSSIDVDIKRVDH